KVVVEHRNEVGVAAEPGDDESTTSRGRAVPAAARRSGMTTVQTATVEPRATKKRGNSGKAQKKGKGSSKAKTSAPAVAESIPHEEPGAEPVDVDPDEVAVELD